MSISIIPPSPRRFKRDAELVGGRERKTPDWSTNFFGDRSGTALGVVDFGVDAPGSDVGHGGLECGWEEARYDAKESECAVKLEERTKTR